MSSIGISLYFQPELNFKIRVYEGIFCFRVNRNVLKNQKRCAMKERQALFGFAGIKEVGFQFLLALAVKKIFWREKKNHRSDAVDRNFLSLLCIPREWLKDERFFKKMNISFFKKHLKKISGQMDEFFGKEMSGVKYPLFESGILSDGNRRTYRLHSGVEIDDNLDLAQACQYLFPYFYVCDPLPENSSGVQDTIDHFCLPTDDDGYYHWWAKLGQILLFRSRQCLQAGSFLQAIHLSHLARICMVRTLENMEKKEKKFRSRMKEAYFRGCIAESFLHWGQALMRTNGDSGDLAMPPRKQGQCAKKILLIGKKARGFL